MEGSLCGCLPSMVPRDLGSEVGRGVRRADCVGARFGLRLPTSCWCLDIRLLPGPAQQSALKTLVLAFARAHYTLESVGFLVVGLSIDSGLRTLGRRFEAFGS